MEKCDDALKKAKGGDECPETCRPVFRDLPRLCATFIDESLPAGFAVPPSVLNGSEPFDICDLLLCEAEGARCEMPLSVLYSLDLFQLEVLEGQWSAQPAPNSGGSGSTFSGVKVAVIVASVVAGNVIIVLSVAGIVWLRHHRQKARRLTAQAVPEPAAASGRSSSGGGGAAAAGADVKLEPADSAEQGYVSAIGKHGGGGGALEVSAAAVATAAAAAAAAASGASSSSLSLFPSQSVGSSLVAAGSGALRTLRPPPPATSAADGAGASPATADGAQRVAALWAAATAGAPSGGPPQHTQGAAGLGVAGGTALPARSLASLAGTASLALSLPGTEYLQHDEHEMMLLGSHGGALLLPAGSGSGGQSLAQDPVISWVSSHLQQQQQRQVGSLLGGSARRGSGNSSLAGTGTADGAAAEAAPPQHGGSEGAAGAEQQQQQQQQQQGEPGSGAGGPPPAPDAAELPQRAGSSGASGLGLEGGPRLNSGLVDLTPWHLPFDDLELQRPLGEGSFGRVFLAKWRETLVAVKLLLAADDVVAASSSGGGAGGAGAAFGGGTLSRASSATIQTLQKEAGLMAALRHPNIVQFIGVSTSPPAVISEFCSRGSLLDLLRAAHGSEAAAASLTWVRRLSMALDAAKGMLCLHAHGPPIIHRDLKSPNLLVDSAWRVKVADFNLSKLVEARGGGASSAGAQSSAGGALNPRWLAPEILVGRPATAASDVFSFGVVLHELLTWELPWAGANLYQLVFSVSQGARLPVPPVDQLPGPEPLREYDAYVALMQRCWAQLPEERPSFADVISELRAMLSRTLVAAAGTQQAP